MSFNDPQMAEALLDEATDRLRAAGDIAPPAGVIASTRDALGARSKIQVRQAAGLRTLRWGGLAATSLLALAAVFALVLQGGPQVALAQVLEQAQKADSVEFVLSQGVGEAAQDLRCILQGEKLRTQFPAGIVMLADRMTNEALYLDAQNKTYCRFTLPEHVANELATDPITQLRKVGADMADVLGKEVVEGKEAEVCRVQGIHLFGAPGAKGEMRVWVETASKLPLRIELRTGKLPMLTFKELKWNVAIDPALLGMNVPEGFAERPVDAFRKQLDPASDERSKLSPTEAFRQRLGRGE